MICYAPLSLKNPNGQGRVTVPCGKCPACQGNRRKEWSFRLQQELKISKQAVFVTMTYTDDNLTYVDDTAVLQKRDVQLFMKRLRKEVKQRIKYYIVGEYGDKTFRPHYHAIFFLNDYVPDLQEQIQKAWKLGFIHQGTVSEKSISYTLKYMLKQQNDSESKEFKQFALMSKGLGKEYITKVKKYHRADRDRAFVNLPGGVKTRMPRYYREKLYTKLERQIQNAKILEYMDSLSKDGSLQDIRDKEERKSDFARKMEQNRKRNSRF